MLLLKVKKTKESSFRRRPESSIFKMSWTPACAGETAFGNFYETIKTKTPKLFISV